MSMPSFEALRERLHYDQTTGVFTWLQSCRGTRAGSIAGCRQRRYVLIGFDGHLCYAHRLAWLYMTGAEPAEEIDHADGCGHNNAWSNLRAANRSEQLQNTKMSRRNKSGHKGVCWDARRQRWYAQIASEGRNYRLGRFRDLKEAASAYEAAKAKLHTFHPTVGRA